VEQERVLARVQVLVWEQEQVLAVAVEAMAVEAVKYPSQ
jgi:hypothetical protein